MKIFRQPYLSTRKSPLYFGSHTGVKCRSGLRIRTTDPDQIPLGGGLRSDVTRVGVTRDGNWRCHPYFFLKKLTDLFIHFTRVSPPPLEDVTPHLFTCPTSFVHCSL